MSQVLEPRTYRREECAVFRKTNEAYGGLSNMAPGFPVRVNGVLILTVEALYQACRFPHMPEVQRRILEQHSPMTAKMVSKPYRDDSRPDWDRVRVKIMRWCLRLKLLMHRSSFSDLLLSTGDRPIVEDSRKDDFWGALPVDSKTLVGRNVLGRLLMELREEIKSGSELRALEPPAIPSFLLYGQSMGGLDFRTDKGIQRAEAMNVGRVPAKGASEPLFPELFPESNGVNTSLTKPQRDESREHHLLNGVKPYTKYRESGLPWLGIVPEHWNLLPNRGLIRRRKVLVGKHHRDYRLLSLTKQGVIVRDISAGKGKFSSDMGTSQKVRNGDLVFCLFDVPETPRTVGLSRHDGMITGAYTVFESLERGNREYFELFYRAMDDRKLLSPLYSGLRHTIPVGRFLGTKTPQPSLEEQDAIVRFLEWANGRLNQAVRAKRKVIALLNEQKQAIIHRAVTRGLDSSGPLKPSGVSWLGEIPQHWNAIRIKYLLREVDERSETGSEPLLSMRMHHGLVLFAEHFSRPPQAATLVGFKLVRPGQFVVNRMQAGNGVIFASSLTGLVSPDYAVFDPIGDADVEFLGELFRSRNVRAKFRAESKGLGTGTSGFLRLYNDRLGAIHVALPPTEEQRRILTRLSIELAGVNTAISRGEREIDLLREYRTRLVADVVTGKLDVREAATKLPVEEQANEPGDELVDEAAEAIEDEMTEPVA